MGIKTAIGIAGIAAAGALAAAPAASAATVKAPAPQAGQSVRALELHARHAPTVRTFSSRAQETRVEAAQGNQDVAAFFTQQNYQGQRWDLWAPDGRGITVTLQNTGFDNGSLYVFEHGLDTFITMVPSNGLGGGIGGVQQGWPSYGFQAQSVSFE